MNRTIHWLSEHPLFNWLLVLVYGCFLLFAHVWFVDLSVKIMNRLSIPVYDQVVGVAVLFAGIGSAVFLLLVLGRGKGSSDSKVLGYFIGTLVLLVAHFFILTEMNIEFIHALMYGMLAILLFPIVGRYGGAIVLGLPLMLVDEWYQHVILFPHYTDFFEFNDIVLDLLGAGLFISILAMLGVPRRQAARPFFKRPEVLMLALVAFTILGLMITCIIVPYTELSCSNTWFVLNKLPEMTEFWYHHPTIGSTFHILKPYEGLVAISVVCFGYLAMEPIRSEKLADAILS